ncbi:hypothetical protein AB0L71_10225 [Streptomyces sp. NPDC052052]|uniref:hypothetical protein n=1 Tax=Streptomyces sp. NPDC052052 TaxID=3154756 RepID=UPI00343BFF98
MIAIAAVLAEIVLILVDRKRASTATEIEHLAYMAAGLGGCVAGWLVFGRPGSDWSDLFLPLFFGVIVASQAADAARGLSGKAWVGWATVCGAGVASSTWLLPDPLPFM